MDEIVFQLQELVNRSRRLHSKLSEDLSSAKSMLQYHLSQAANFKKQAMRLSAVSGGRILNEVISDKLIPKNSESYSRF